MNKYWFKPKQYGYGYVPISFEGFIAVLILIGIGIFLAYINKIFNPTGISFLNAFVFTIEILILGFVFIKIFEKKCKGNRKIIGTNIFKKFILIKL